MPSTKQSLSARAVAVELLAAAGRPQKVKELVAAALADLQEARPPLGY